MEFLLRSIDLGLARFCNARQCSKKAVYTVRSVCSKGDWSVFAGALCEEHAEGLKEIFPVTVETLTRVEYT